MTKRRKHPSSDEIVAKRCQAVEEPVHQADTLRLVQLKGGKVFSISRPDVDRDKIRPSKLRIDAGEEGGPTMPTEPPRDTQFVPQVSQVIDRFRLIPTSLSRVQIPRLIRSTWNHAVANANDASFRTLRHRRFRHEHRERQSIHHA